MVISEPKVADAVVVSPREVMVNAKGPGRTTLVVWETGAEPARYEVNVTKDMAEWDAFRKQMLDSADGSPITVTGTGETVVLSGTVKVGGRVQAAGGTGAGAGEERRESAAIAAAAGAAADPAAGEVRRHRPGGAVADRIQPVQHQRQADRRVSTQQFPSPRFSQIADQDGKAQPTVNFSDLLNLFAFRPDLNFGATIKALQNANLLQILAEPNLITLEGKDASFLAGGQFPYPDHHDDPDRRRDRARSSPCSSSRSA